MKLKRKVLTQAEPINLKIDKFYQKHYKTIKQENTILAKRYSDMIFLSKKNTIRVIYLQEQLRDSQKWVISNTSQKLFEQSIDENIKTGIQNIQETINDYISVNISFLVFEPIELL